MNKYKELLKKYENLPVKETYLIDKYCFQLDLEKVIKKAQAFDILATKKVDTTMVKYCAKLIDYNDIIRMSKYELLTEEEFNLLKEVLK